jgi:hypothetical protein
MGICEEPGDKVAHGLGALAGMLKEALEMKTKLLEGGNAG